MSTLHPFRPLLPPASRVAAVASVPYDVINTEEARAMAAGNPHSFLHVIRPEIDLAANTKLYSKAVYARGKLNLEKAIRDIPLTLADEPSLYVYRLKMGDRTQTGVVGCCAVDEYDDDRIRKHERTRRDKEDDRTKHVVEMSCQAEPIFLAYRDRADIDSLVNKIVGSTPMFDFTADDGVAHSVWRVPTPETPKLVAMFGRVPLLYVADGHHRSASASRARAHFREQNPGHTGEEAYNRVLATLFPAGQLRILPYNRIVLDLGGKSTEKFLRALRERFPLTPDAPPTPVLKGDFRICVPEAGKARWYGFHIASPPDGGPIDALDVSLLQGQVLAPLLGIDDPRTSPKLDFVGGIRGTDELERLVVAGKAAAAFSLYPTSLYQLMSVADQGQIMPPKSTWFEPKLRSGLFLHRI